MKRNETEAIERLEREAADMVAEAQRQRKEAQRLNRELSRIIRDLRWRVTD